MENRTLLIVILVAILLLYVTFFAYIIVRYVMPRNNVQSPAQYIKESDELINQSIDLNSPYQTSFFNNSCELAKKVLFGKHIIHEYGDARYYGNALLDVVGKLNDETKDSIVIAIKYMCIEPNTCRNNERSFRYMAEAEKVPLWFLILREATKKVVPELMQEQLVIQKDNIVPLYQKTG